MGWDLSPDGSRRASSHEAAAAAREERARVGHMRAAGLTARRRAAAPVALGSVPKVRCSAEGPVTEASKMEDAERERSSDGVGISTVVPCALPLPEARIGGDCLPSDLGGVAYPPSPTLAIRAAEGTSRPVELTVGRADGEKGGLG